MKRSLIALAAVFTLAAVGCSSKDSTGPKAPSLTGTWTGVLAGIDVAMTLTEGSGGSVTGTASLTNGSSVLGLAVAGSHKDPSVTLSMTAPGFQPAIYSATMADANDVRGEVNGSGFALDSLTLVRQ